MRHGVAHLPKSMAEDDVTDMPVSATTNQASAFSDAGASGTSKLPPLVITLFMASMVLPIYFQVGSVRLMPHRVILLVLFVPLVIQLLAGRAGRMAAFDILMIFSVAWAVIAIALNENFLGNSNIQPMGIYTLEALGAYLLGRVKVRSREDFAGFVRLFFWVLVILVPFAIVESVTHRAVMLELIPKSVQIVYADVRWGLRRAQTVFGHPILFGVFSGIGFGLFWYVMQSRFMRLGGAFLSVLGTFFSLSSGALISITMQMVFIGWEAVTKSIAVRWRIFAVLCVLAYVAIDLLSNRTPFHVLVSYATFNSGSSYNRILIWRFGMENVWMNPWFGLGENVQSWVRPSYMSSSADNFWLLMAMKFGIPSFLAMAIALAMIIRQVARAPIRHPLSMACRAGYLTTIGGLIIAGGTVHFWHGVMAFVMFIFGSGVWIIEEGRKEAEAGETPDHDAGDVPMPAAANDRALSYTRQYPLRDRRNRGRIVKTSPEEGQD